MEVLTESSVDHAGSEVGLGDVLEAAGARIDARFAQRPEIAAGLRHALGNNLLNLNRLEAAGRQLEAALVEARAAFGPSSLLAWQISDSLALLRVDQGRYSEAAALLEEVLADALRAGQRDTPFFVRASNNLGYLYMEREEYELAEPPVAAALAAIEQGGVQIPRDEYSSLLTNQGQILHGLNRREEADVLYRRAYEILQEEYPEATREMAIQLNNRALLLFDMGRREEALELARESVELRRRTYRGDHPMVAFGLTNLVGMALGAGNLDKALAAGEEAVAVAERLEDTRSDIKVLAQAALAQAYVARGDLAPARAALAHARRALEEMPEVSPRAKATLDGLEATLREREAQE
jgi:tetratricopeptide (TPR) repeat protein